MIWKLERSALSATLICALALPPMAQALTEDKWRCVPGPDGEWVCTEAEMPVGPFEPAPMAAIYSRPKRMTEEERARRDADPDIPRPGQSAEQARLTWFPRRALDAEARAELAPWCPGTYVERDWTEEELSADPNSAPIEMQAQLVDYLLGSEGTLGESVVVSQGPRRVTAEDALFDELERIVTLEGNVRLVEPGILLRGDTASYDLDDGRAELTEAQFVLYRGHYRGSASVLRRENGVITVEDAEFTRCEPGNDGWKLASGRIELPEGEDYGVARDTRFEVGGVPVFWTPYLSFPTTDERKSGFLSPAMGYAGQDGVDIALPYYLNLAPNYDATITPRLMSERGLLMETEFRHLGRRTRNQIGGAYIYQDDNYNGEYSFDEFKDRVLNGLEPSGTFEAEERWLANVDHTGAWMPGLATRVNYVGVSDRDYFRDLGTDLGISARTEVERTASVDYRNGGLALRLWAQDIYLLEDDLPDAYTRLPQLDVDYSRRMGDLPLVLSVSGHHAIFDRDDAAATGLDGMEGSRSHVVPRLTIPLEWSYAYLRSSLAYQYTVYDLDDVPTGLDDSPDRGLPTASVDAGLIFEKDVSVLGRRVIHTIEPRLYYLYVEEEDQSQLPVFDSADLTFGYNQLFRENRFAGVDRIGDADQLTTAFTTRLLSAQDGREMLAATFGQIQYFEDRDVTLSGDVADVERNDASGWLTEVVVRLGAGLDARALWVWDSESDREDQTTFDLRYRADARRLFNLRYRERADDIRQVDTSLLWPVSERFSLIGRYFYDLENEETIEAFGGLQYDDCCWRVRVIGRQYQRFFNSLDQNDTETGLFVDVVMKGLAGFGTGVDDIMQDGIIGYREQDINDML